ncbi:MAG: hypothetical protein QGF28_01570 [Candidatus Thalassarchaeaceae archaeon]|jgi:hypothetical protein|nr:hypothetical protein [Candidatus Thalassarchaeaceae archaeon]MDP7256476.1 hypothetical protein [Candidatus Thalassarchaeaceae archaeon]MDP7445882.1 hypothetical protein [Candidatus Thalassarchaeaceae archaeon]MDP7648856.1 hypothetical protein [Candidatus Thalassarchaeaceae archaeon]HJL54328.1 hypothetical protein [Candidatus Thalassarchaeaceae archaeon]|tara:strand:- start:365 stop:535 length:171 start_codon:yes stop_codon:yes gene_type:complete
MADWSDPELLKALAISIVGLGVGLWWISSRILLKIEQVKERQSGLWRDSSTSHADE